jgi:hypothetical protein
VLPAPLLLVGFGDGPPRAWSTGNGWAWARLATVGLGSGIAGYRPAGDGRAGAGDGAGVGAGARSGTVGDEPFG